MCFELKDAMGSLNLNLRMQNLARLHPSLHPCKYAKPLCLIASLHPSTLVPSKLNLRRCRRTTPF